MSVNIGSIIPLTLDPELVRTLFPVAQTQSDPTIDDVLDQTARWNFQAAAGTGVTLKYGFSSSAPAYDPGNVDDTTYTAFSAQQIAGLEAALAEWSDVADISFQRDDNAADLMFRQVDITLPGVAGFAFYPPGNGTHESQGDIYIEPGSIASLQVAVHEIGHALGLAHPFEGGDRPVPEDYGFDSNQLLSIMNYDSPGRDLRLTITNNGNGYSIASIQDPETPMPLDMLAMQLLYGRNDATRAGNTVYTYAANPVFYATIWDGGGIDTIDVSNQTRPSLISLVEGSFSTIALRDPFAGLAQPLVDSILAVLPATRFFDGSNMLAIAFDAVIENAIGGSAGDRLIGNAVRNTLTGNAGNDTLEGAGGHDRLIGGAGRDTLIGGAGHDVLAGGAGPDFLDGGPGNDTYVVGPGDTFGLESLNGGTDTVKSSITLTLAANFENLVLLGGSGIGGTGNSLANTITGNSGSNALAGAGGNDTLDGAAGHDTLLGGAGLDRLLGGSGNDSLNGGVDADTLLGGAGNDTLAGGPGNDSFVFDAPLSAVTNVDIVTDFSHLADRLLLDDDVFTQFSAGVPLLAGQFHSAPGANAAQDADDRIIYDTVGGRLYYDADGNAAGFPATQFARLAGAPVLSVEDFLIVA